MKCVWCLLLSQNMFKTWGHILPPDSSGPFSRFQRDFSDMSGLWPDMSGEQYDRCNLNSIGVVRPLLRTCPGPNEFVSSERDFLSEWPELVWSLHTSLTNMVDRSALTAPMTSFPVSYKRHSTPSLVGCLFLTVCITFLQPLELSPTTLCEIYVLCGGF
jgi:hypothetical protein